jgi:lipopolysaccharide export system ATP-binding protein
MANRINKPGIPKKRISVSANKKANRDRTAAPQSQTIGASVENSISPQNNLPIVPASNDTHMALRSDGLVKRYKKRTVVKDVSVQVQRGEIVGLLGPNGAGKTTTFYMIVGMIRPNGGNVFLDDIEITKMPMYKRARMGIGYLPQEASVFRRLSVRDNLLAVLQTTDLSRKAQDEKCDRLMEEFGLTHLAKSMGYVLSGGERRRTEIARALALDPKFFLLDEPFAGIDPIAVEDIMQIVIKLKEKNIGVLITDHNVHETLSITDRSYLLFEGKILKSGTAEYLANDPEAKKLYLGENFKLDRYE